MKRLGLYLFVGVMIVGTFGGFVGPKKVHATVTEVEVSAVISKTQAVLPKIQGPNITIPIFGTFTLLDSRDEIINRKFLDDLGKDYLSKKNTPSSTVVEMEASILNDYRTFLIKKINTSGLGQETKGVSALYNASIQPLVTAANIALDLKNGNITKEQADTIINASPETQKKLLADAMLTRPNPEACSLSGGNLLTCIDQLFAEFIKVTLLEIAGFLLWFSSNIFNLSIQVGVLHFDKWAPEQLYSVFIVVRQIISLVILFTGLYLVGLYIIGREEKITHFLPWLALFALFVNFSYPMTRALVDISNVVSLNVYTSVVGPTAIEGSGDATAGGIIINRLGLGQLATGAADTRKNGIKSFVGDIQSTPGSLMAVAYVLYAAYILFMSAAIFIFRTMALVFLTVVSPLLFVDSVVPMLGEHAVKLRKIFVEQLLVAPLFMVMLALTLKFLDVFQTVDPKTGVAGPLAKMGVSSLASGSTGSITLFFNILMMLIMLHIMYTVTKKVSGAVGQSATNFMGKVGGFGMGLASGGTGMLARASLGRVAAAARDSNWITDNKNGFLGKTAFRMTNSLAGGNYDLRNIKAVSGGMAKAGMGMGTGTTKNYEQAKEEKEKQKVEDYATVGTYRANVYAPDGTLLHRKGERDASRSGAREKFMKDAGGVLGGGKDLQQKLRDSDKAQRDKATAEYASLEGIERQSFFNKQDKATQEKLALSDVNPARAENKEFNKENGIRGGLRSGVPITMETEAGTSSTPVEGKVNYDLPPSQRGFVSTRGTGQELNGDSTTPKSTGGEVDYDIPPSQRGFVSNLSVNQKLKEELEKKQTPTPLDLKKAEIRKQNQERERVFAEFDANKKLEEEAKKQIEAEDRQENFNNADAETQSRLISRDRAEAIKQNTAIDRQRDKEAGRAAAAENFKVSQEKIAQQKADRIESMEQRLKAQILQKNKSPEAETV